MRINRHSIFFKIFFGLWLTMMIFALTPPLIFLMSSQDNRDLFYSHTRREMGKKVVSEIRNVAKTGNIEKIQKLTDFVEKTLKIKTYVFDKERNEVLGQDYPAQALELLNEMDGGKVVLIKQFSKDPKDTRVTRVIRAGDYMFTAIPIKDENPGYIALITAYHLRIFLYILLLSFLASIIILRFLTKPLMTLRNAAEKIANGNFDVRVSDELKRKDEMGLLAADFDKMTERLIKNRQDQENILRNISHELRSPLTRLRLSLELARAKAGDNASNALDRIESETEKLNEMISWLLEVFRQKDSGMVNTEVITLCDELKEIISDAEFETSENNKTLESSVECTSTIKTNRIFMKSAMENIIRNAIKYSKTKVDINAYEEEGYLIVTVCDDGPGVGEEHLDDIFLPFYRVDKDRDRKTGGSGLGLAITKAFVDANNGNIKAYNLSENSGFCLEITIPVLKK
ncbi:MAG: hypothetical protein C0602_02395 [Denitrovibrio sp.]|nr:MAG: hypothetical protein C0602_02395 [Denitrovibrio sp.]